MDSDDLMGWLLKGTFKSKRCWSFFVVFLNKTVFYIVENNSIFLKCHSVLFLPKGKHTIIMLSSRANMSFLLHNFCSLFKHFSLDFALGLDQEPFLSQSWLKQSKWKKFFSDFLVPFVTSWHSETCLLRIQKVLGKNPRNVSHVKEKRQNHA